MPVARKRLIHEQWTLFRKLLPLDTGPDQIIDMRRAFYGGSSALFYVITHRLSDGQEATDDDISMMDDIAAEFVEFSELIKNGVA